MADSYDQSGMLTAYRVSTVMSWWMEIGLPQVGERLKGMVHGERFNSITHLIGAALAAVGGTILVVLASLSGDPWKIVSFSIYGLMLFCLYLASTLYHSLRGRAKRIWCRFDHCAIYLLIAGSYTPFALVSLRGPWGWALFGTIWGLAILGIVQEIWLAKGLRIFSVVLYVLMGWLAVIAIA